jgi:RNA polymerase sigma-70 factor, ECF subfamily
LDRQELESLIRQHQTAIFRYLLYLGADPSGAEDLTQDTFLAALRRPQTPDAEQALANPAWLRGIARNLFLADCRRRRISPVFADSDAVDHAEQFWNQEFADDPDGSGHVQALRQCLEMLPEAQRRAVQMRYTQRAGRGEMAASLGLSEDGVKSLLRRVRAALGDCVTRRLKQLEAK